jgi:hypothetical protein
MMFAIVHNQSLEVLFKCDAKDNTDASLQYVTAHPELECETLAEFYSNFPGLAAQLACVTLQ